MQQRYDIALRYSITSEWKEQTRPVESHRIFDNLLFPFPRTTILDKFSSFELLKNRLTISNFQRFVLLILFCLQFSIDGSL